MRLEAESTRVAADVVLPAGLRQALIRNLTVPVLDLRALGERSSVDATGLRADVVHITPPQAERWKRSKFAAKMLVA